MHKEQRLSQIIKTEEEVSNVNYQCYFIGVIFRPLARDEDSLGNRGKKSPVILVSSALNVFPIG